MKSVFVMDFHAVSWPGVSLGAPTGGEQSQLRWGGPGCGSGQGVATLSAQSLDELMVVGQMYSASALLNSCVAAGAGGDIPGVQRLFDDPHAQ